MSREQQKRTFTIPMNRNAMAEYLNVERGALSRELSYMKGESMNKDTSKTSHTTALLDVKPDLVKRIGNTTFDIHIHFSETSRETLHTEMGNYTLNSGDALVFDSSVKHTYINEQDVMLTFMVVNFYPN